MYKKYTLPFWTFMLLVAHLAAQNNTNRRFQAGFFLGSQTQSMGIQPLDATEPEKAAVRAARPHTGMTLGAYFHKQLWRGISFQPALQFGLIQNKAVFVRDGIQTYRFADAEMPLHLVITDRRKQDIPLRGCILFGPRLGWNMAKNPDNLLSISRERFGIDLGIGAEIRIGKWQLQPAFVYSHGLNNLHNLNNTPYDWEVGRVVRDKLDFRVLATFGPGSGRR